MNTVTIPELKRAVENLHNCRAKHRKEVSVIEQFEGKTVWQGTVHVFDIEGHPQAKVCYAWSSPIEESEKRRFYAVLHMPPVESPEDAVRAAIVRNHKQK